MEKANQLVILKEEQIVYSLLLCKKELVQVNAEQASSGGVLLGNIYIGKVKNIVKNINAAFVEIAGGVMCYLPLSKPQHPIYCNGMQRERICIGDEIMVQIERENVKTKSPTVTCNLNITGKYVVLTHGITKTGISAKIVSNEERARLKDIVSPYLQDSYGFVIRTNSEGVEEKRILQEIQALQSVYQRITQQEIHFTRFSLIEKGLPNYLADIRDFNQCQIDEIITDQKEIYEEIHAFLSMYQPEDLSKLAFYQDSMISMKNLYSIETKLQKALHKRVWLKSGGYLVIEPTEALTVIDVNTGKAVKGKKNEQETYYRINSEAAEEIAKQIRLRNMSGIIIIDFIDLEDEEKRKSLMNQLKHLFAKDPVKTALIDMTKLNLVEVTRKKVRKPLWEQIKIRRDEDGESSENQRS
ncbi:ribonuclease E/G [[Clostridium] polysaccharolyticum]|uniref:Ribonuclease G n=1 Tax=[Clostridium] polysaccharolyticum TaxID=29364 RepID=A0A1I0ATS0_9FIRM|nr:ribonuclease E/G [[Clostridium] polysaccharolyticum]SES97149.1 ribonuclease G [[Clostridium] polysaccharolyticum]